ncbi:ribosomal rna methyltransferase 1 [Phaffia rhodozyma]|uniref:Ribosomal rna methyltransferase 1 n=1 Tax=Phaffia rhodozyma TaxID=264483 RepID=A0A0F7SRN8_PHARH|nr:ribosomal rna methyltransferase 1 [Phaffia rhodozyma]
MGKSSNVDSRDIYYRLSKSEGYRARSAYKLLHIAEEFDIFPHDLRNAVDLCAAPGSWSQVLVKKLNEVPNQMPAKIVAVDLQPMAPLEGVVQITGDITSPKTAAEVISAMDGEKAQLVICDGAPDVTGLHTLDSHLQAQLLLAAFSISVHLLAPGGTFIAKIFRTPQDPGAEWLVSQLRSFFPETDRKNRETKMGGVWVRKPRSSREGSGEAFIICRNFTPLPGLMTDCNSRPGTSLLDIFRSVSLSDPISNPIEQSDTREAEKVEKMALGWTGGGDLS